MKKILYILLSLSIFTACTFDSEDAGTENWQKYTTDIFDLHVQGNIVKSICNDDDVKLELVKEMRVSDELARPDTTYRMVISYYLHDDKSLAISSNEMVAVLSPVKESLAKTTKTDAVKIDNAWMGTNGKYLNVRMGLLTGTDTSDAHSKHVISLVLDDVKTGADGRKIYCVSLRHDQKNIPQYYTVTYYFSIPVSGLAEGDAIEFTVNTFKGEFKKTYIKK